MATLFQQLRRHRTVRQLLRAVRTVGVPVAVGLLVVAWFRSNGTVGIAGNSIEWFFAFDAAALTHLALLTDDPTPLR